LQKLWASNYRSDAPHRTHLAAGGTDARNSFGDGLDRNRHVKRIGVKKALRIAHDGDVALPEYEIAALEIGAICDRRAKRSFLHIAVART
jgi:hypothetical protein